MPKVSEVYNGAGLKADDDVPDLEDGGLVLTIIRAELKEFENNGKVESKISLDFKETDKSLILNKTNADTLAKMFGSDETDDWLRRRIKLYAMDTTFNGKPMRGIRVHSRPVKSGRAEVAPGGADFDETADPGYDPPPKRPAPGADVAAAVESMEL